MVSVLRPSQRILDIPGIGVRTSRRAVGIADSSILTDLIAYWKLDEESGARIDSHGNNNLTDNNTVAQTVGRVGAAALFAAANSETLSISDNASLSTGDIDFTVWGWLKFVSLSSFQHIFGKWGASGEREYVLYFDALPGDNRLKFYVSNDGTSATAVTASSLGAPVVNTWYFVVAWHNATAKTINIQVNNGTVNSASYATGVFNSSTAFVIGGRGGTSPSSYFNGRADEIGFLKRVLTEAERTTLYNDGYGVTYPFGPAQLAAQKSDAGPAWPMRFILDCDPGSDCDDVGDFAMIHALMDAGELEMLAAITERTLIYSPGAIDAINTYYNRGSIPIGANKGAPFLTNDSYAQHLDDNFPNDMDYATAIEGVALYRQILAAQSSTVKILSTGPIRLVSALFQSPADGYSVLTGLELVAAKVSEIIVVGGRWKWSPATPEYNFEQDPAAASYVFANSPVPIAIVNIEDGDTIITGAGLSTNTPTSNPVRKAYEIRMGGPSIGREAWAQLGVLYLARLLRHEGTAYFDYEPGTGSVNASTGAVTWTPGFSGNHKLLSKKLSDASLAALIDGYLNHIPS